MHKPMIAGMPMPRPMARPRITPSSILLSSLDELVPPAVWAEPPPVSTIGGGGVGGVGADGGDGFIT